MLYKICGFIQFILHGCKITWPQQCCSCFCVLLRISFSWNEYIYLVWSRRPVHGVDSCSEVRTKPCLPIRVHLMFIPQHFTLPSWLTVTRYMNDRLKHYSTWTEHSRQSTFWKSNLSCGFLLFGFFDLYKSLRVATSHKKCSAQVVGSSGYFMLVCMRMMCIGAYWKVRGRLKYWELLAADFQLRYLSTPMRESIPSFF